MPDPFEALRAPDTPIDPDPAFAAGLRAQVERALTLPRGADVTDLVLEHEPAPATTSTVTPYLAVAGAERALDWYAEVFGARLLGEPIVMPDGRIGHADFEIDGATFMLSEQYPEIGVVAPSPDEGVQISLHLTVDDVDAVVGRAATAGARVERDPANYEYGRNGVIRDPFGHRWMIAGDPTTPGPRHGDVGYVSLWVPDVDRAATFFAGVLGWQYGPGSGPQGRQVEGLTLHHGLWGGEPRSTLFCCFAVDDVDEAVRRVRAAGGQADEPYRQSYGRIAECVDDQGTRFAVFTPPGGTTGTGPPAGTRPGDVSYITMEVVDSVRTRAFYGSVLGWRFRPGRVEDGWQVEAVAPMVGISGGHDEATAVPMYQVDDVEAAVARVRGAGGTASDPAVQPYGVTSDCVDDQGTRFYLGQT
jgi:predicted enzyme related to lactoylglutathione lyase